MSSPKSDALPRPAPLSAARRMDATPAAIAEGASLIRAGGLVAFPTETVYGLGADAGNDRAVARLFAAKGRPRFNPLIVHVADRAAAARLVEINAIACALVEKFWPGPLTLVLPRLPTAPFSLLACAGLDTVAVRVPAHPVAQALLAAAGCPIAAPSANRSGALSPTTADHVARSLGDAVDLILDGGACPVGLESTVVDLSGTRPALLRPGGLDLAEIETITGALDSVAEDPAAPRSPGQLARHYAPGKPIRLDATTAAADEALIAFGQEVPAGAAMTVNLSASGDLTEAAANLFAHLHTADAAPVAGIAVMAIPERGLGRAINDRLRRAAESVTERP
ncbi:MAG: threonylcarbamoyl-AMP synthase [Alphaproteobacteria bacterium]|nr:threonylcarbamoyl-AMP synthase [Alphaproteobacteria bacterium]